MKKNHAQMESWLNSMPGQIEAALHLGRRFAAGKNFGPIRRVLFYGMGGSAIGGDILKAVMADRSQVLFSVYRQGRWSRWTDRRTLVVFSSYSGNTAEILEVFKLALRSKDPLLAVTSGGHLQRLAEKNGVACLQIPAGMPPRCALGFLTFALLPVLEKIGRFRIPAAEIEEVLQVIRRVPRATARRLAAQLHGRLLHIYAVSGYMQSAATRWRAEIAENAKMLASHHLLPEMFHNEIEGWMHPRWAVRKSSAVFLTDRDDLPGLAGKINAALRLLRSRGARAVRLSTRGKSRLARLFSLIALGDWVSYELALRNRVDPAAIPAISAIKRVRS